ncbi:MAG: cytochrome c3 family protein, partial [Gemmatimonadales bacterium]
DPSNNALLFPPPSDQNDCVACHQDDYDAQHSGSGFPTTCVDCHTQTTWTGATFQHDQYFPINSGIHSGKWNGCDTCHNVPNDYTIFTCFACHQHAQARMDSRHADVVGYSYESTACYSCHPNGRR